MIKRRFVAFVVLVSCLLIGLTIAIRRSHEDLIHRGQSLQSWSRQAYQGDSNAIAALAELGTNAIPELIQLLKTKDSFLRKQTWMHLPKLPLRLRQNIARRFPPPQAEAVREAAALALGRLGADAAIAIPALSHALRDNQGRVRWEAATAMGRIGKDSVTILIKALDDKDAKARHAAAYALGQIGPEAVAAVSALVRCLNDIDPAVQHSAAFSLTTIGIPGLLALIDSSEQAQEPGRTVASRMLTNSYLPHLRLTSEFSRMLKNESPSARKRTIEVLRTSRVAGGLAIHASLAALNDPVMEVRLAAIETLGMRGGTETNLVQVLTHCLKDEAPEVRDEAARALGRLDDQARANGRASAR